ncbi:aminotransferase family protein (LolT) [Diplocarpon rosae]|nr:aminotransferase family protein (LolT) [Diplocarpon rosae]
MPTYGSSFHAAMKCPTSRADIEHLMLSSLSPSHNFKPVNDPGIFNVIPSAKSTFISQFEANGAIDNTCYNIVNEAIGLADHYRSTLNPLI